MQYLHNPRCTKSRQGLDLLKQQGLDPKVRLYLQDPLERDELEMIIKALGIGDIKMMMRTKEPEFKQLNLTNASQSDLIKAMLNTPKLIERPILINGEQARIGRPPENLLEIL